MSDPIPTDNDPEPDPIPNPIVTVSKAKPWLSVPGYPNLRMGNPGNRGGPGRPPTKFYQRCETMADDVVLPKLMHVLSTSGPEDPVWRYCADYVSKYARSPAPTSTKTETDVELRVIVTNE